MQHSVADTYAGQWRMDRNIILYPVEYQNLNYFSVIECALSFEITVEDYSDKLVFI